MKRGNKMRCVVQAAFAAVLLVSATSAAPAAPVKLDVASTASLFPQFYPLKVAQERGYLSKEDITVEQIATGGGGATVQPVISGATPIGLASMSATMLAALRGAPIKVISGVSPNFLATIVYVVPADSLIRHLADLAGKGQETKVGYTSGGSITDVASAEAAKAEHLADGKDIVRVALGSMQAVATALLSHQIGVGVANVSAVANLVVEGKLRIIGNTSDYMKNYEANAIIVNTSYLDSNKDTVKRFLKAYSEAVAYSDAHRDWVVNLYAKDKGIPLRAAQVVLSQLSWTTTLDHQGFDNQLNLLKQVGLVKGDVDDSALWSRLVDLSLLSNQ